MQSVEFKNAAITMAGDVFLPKGFTGEREVPRRSSSCTRVVA